MARFNLDDYETVESRIKRFYEQFPDGRITTELETVYTVSAKEPNVWVVKASVYLSAGDQAAQLPKATGYASEVDGTGGANNGSALPNAETSSIGRCLANLGMSGNKRASREEMQRIETLSNRDWVAEADKIADIVTLRWLYAEAKSAGVSGEQLERIQSRGKVLSASGEGQGADGSVSVSPKEQ